MAVVYFPVDRAIQEHDNIINISGGATGIIKPELLESVLVFIKDDGYYPKLEDKLTHLIFSDCNEPLLHGRK